VGYDLVAETAYQELSDPVHITLDVAEQDLAASIAHLQSVGFHLDRPA
jgi:hypothetical protein